MKDGHTHLSHKAEHAVDLETGAIVGITVQDASVRLDVLTDVKTRLTVSARSAALRAFLTSPWILTPRFGSCTPANIAGRSS